MTKLGTSVLAVGILLAGMHAVADDMQKDHLSKEQMMKDCTARMVAKKDGSTKEQIQTACEAEVKKGMGMGMGHDNMDTPKP
jgi:hypothetical protein